MTRVAIIQGHPDAGEPHLCHALAGAHSLKSLEKNILRFAGIKPIKESLFGLVEGPSDARRARWLQEMESLGRRGS